MPIQRQSTLALTDKNWGALNKAISELMNEGTYAELAEIHTNHTHRMHGGIADPIGYQRFLPWHRAYLIVFERELRRIDDTLAIPYWDWNADGGRLEGFPDPADPLFPEESRWRRNPGARQGERRGRVPWFTCKDSIQRAIQGFDNYYDFTRWLERRPHNAGHGWIGGDMGLVMTAPRDPAFWFHHAQVDRLWAQWQKAHPGQMANLAGADAQLDPWQNEFTVENVDNIGHLGDDTYEYVEFIPNP